MAESYKYPSAIKRRLEPAHRELVHRGFLTLADFEERDQLGLHLQAQLGYKLGKVHGIVAIYYHKL